MISWWNTHKTFLFWFLIIFKILFYKGWYITFSSWWKERFFTSEQIIVMWRSEMKQKVHMKTALKWFVRFSPFWNHSGIWKFFIEKFSYILPEFYCSFSVLIIFYKWTCHVYSETICTHLKPETHNIFHCFKRSFWSLIVHWLLPRTLRLIISVIKCRLVREKVDCTWTVSVWNSSDAAHPLWFFPNTVSPYISVRKLIFFSFHGLLKPLMLHGSMSRNKVKEYVHISLVSFFKKICKVLICAVSWCDHIIVLNIVTRITKRWFETWIYPYGITA